MKIVEDVKKFSNNSLKKAIVTIITNPNFHSLCLYRLSNLLYKAKLSPLAKFIWYINRVVYNIDIDYRSKIEGGFCIKHGLGIVIGKNVVINRNCTIYQGVTIGGAGIKREKDGVEFDQPIIGKNSIIYTDAKIFGPVIIGENNVIKANTVIIRDIEDKEK